MFHDLLERVNRGATIAEALQGAAATQQLDEEVAPPEAPPEAPRKAKALPPKAKPGRGKR